MKRVTATQARKQWFQLLDEVAAGEVVAIERKGRWVVLHRDDDLAGDEPSGVPDYRGLLRVADPDAADRWGWTWSGPGDPAFEEERAR